MLVTGPTGSGKTTTLYTGIIQINSIMRKIVTVEDPIEYQIPGITQTQVKPQIGLTFAHVLRSILRQDPNVVMIGEIRDLETAQIAVNGALTGRLVLSTLHTNSAASSITRPARHGARGLPHHRRAARRARPAPGAPALPGLPAAGLAAAPETDPALRSRTALRGRPDHPVAAGRLSRSAGRPAIAAGLAVAEFLLPDERIERLIFSRAEQSEIERAAVEGGMVTMFEAGIAAALTGATTLEEVVRSLRGEA